MKKLLALSLLLCASSAVAQNGQKKSPNIETQSVEKNISQDAKKTNTSEEFDADALDDALDENPDALESDDEHKDPTLVQRYLKQPLTRVCIATYASLPDKVQLALLAGYLYAEDTYESFSEYIQEKYRSLRGLDEDDDMEEQEDEENTMEESTQADSE